MSARPKAPSRRPGSVGDQSGSTDRKDSGAHRTCPVDALEVGLGHAEVVNRGPAHGAMSQRRAIGGDVVGDELPEERPHRGDIGVGVVDELDAEVARSARPPERMQRVLVDPEWRQVLEQWAVAPAVDGRINPFGREAVISDATQPRGHANLLRRLMLGRARRAAHGVGCGSRTAR